MDMNEILNINSIPILENALKMIHEDQFKTQEQDELIYLFQKELLIRIRIKQIEHILLS